MKEQDFGQIEKDLKEEVKETKRKLKMGEELPEVESWTLEDLLEDDLLGIKDQLSGDKFFDY